MSSSFLPAALVAAATLLPPSASAQPAGPQPGQPAAGWQNGFFVQSADGGTRLQVGLLAQLDGRFALDDHADSLIDSFAVRRLRPSIRGTLGSRFEFRLTPDLAGGSLSVQDAYFDTLFSTAFRIRVGKMKSPVGTERQHSAAGMLFIERALPTALTPNRDVGVQVLGDLADGRVSYIAGLLNGSRDGSSSDVDTNDGKELVGRIVVEPFEGLRLALAGSTGEQTGSGALPSYRTTVFQQTFFSYAGASADGRLTRYSPYASFYRGPFGGFVEYVRSELPVIEGEVRRDIEHAAWQAAASWVITGENATEGSVTPRTAFGFGEGWGAFQLAVRYHQLTIGDEAFTLGFAATDANRRAESWSAGLNWYLNRHLLYRLHVERTVFDESDGSRPSENVFAFRSQINF